MPEGQVLEFAGLTKRFGSVLAVDGFTARVAPGAVTGFLGPNGAGKTTTLRMLLGLVRPTAGRVTIGGVPYAGLRQPMQTVGAVLEASSFHPGRTAANHLKVYAQAAGLPLTRVDEALGTVGLADVAGRRIGGYSLGMRQRLGLAGALLGDPGVLVLDEPSNGLDPEGITWMRGLLRTLAGQGRTVLVSSHLLAEVAQTVDRLLIIAHGRLVFQGGLEELSDPSEHATVVDSPDRAGLTAALNAAGIRFEVLRSGLTVRGTDPATVGRVAAHAQVALSLLQRRGPALEEVFFDLVNGLRVHPSAQGMAPPAEAAGVAGAAGAAGAATPPEPATAEPAPTTDQVRHPDIHPDARPGAALTEPGGSEAAESSDGEPSELAESEAAEPSDSEPADNESSDPGDSEASEPGDREASEPGDSVASEPSGSEPTGPGEGKPSEPSDIGPSEPADSAATEPTDREPSEPGDSLAGEPDDSEVSESGDNEAEAAMAAAVAAGLETTGGSLPGAAFAVAATGVIDIIPPDEAESPSPGADDEVVAGEPDHLPDDEDHPEPHTEADAAADAFFHSFDGAADGNEAARDEASTPDEPAPDESAPADAPTPEGASGAPVDASDEEGDRR
ncbi:ATP-binding cassette domain-containing protein [Microbacterium luticocti]|uniref:ATP-binding cassette domain-containing protein n=1 Tax=Microbacterium luticocti TaxID=451764 RepID=UPI0003F9E369|nr:ATP-binding cassette domain-containing protein [Microbacterium luticocti]